VSIGLKDIAELVGMSVSTVSRALRDDPRVNVKTRQRIRLIAKNLNYLPNQAAKSLVTKKTMTIGLVLPNLRSFMHDIFDGLERVLSEAGYNILLGVSDGDPVKEMHELKLLMEKRVDGLILFYVGGVFNQNSIRFLNTINIPLVLVDRYIPRSKFDFVVSDNENGSKALVDYILDLGRHKIAFIMQKEDATALKDRLKGFYDSILGRGIKLRKDYVQSGEGAHIETGYRCTERLLSLDDPPDAIIGSTGDITIGVVKYVTENTGMHDRLMIAGFDDFEYLSLLKIPVSTVKQRTTEMGREAAIILLERTKGLSEDQKRVFLQTELVKRHGLTG
jgi:DNA-binding LacI/PurR family transcriptional regulator